MIKNVLEMMFIERLQIREIAKRLGITQENLQERLKMLVHMGYIKKAVSSGKECGRGCWKCSLSSLCEDDQSTSQKINWYELTEKGKKVIEK